MTAVRVSVAHGGDLGIAPIEVEPGDPNQPAGARSVIVDGRPVAASLERIDAEHAQLSFHPPPPGSAPQTRVLLLPMRPGASRGRGPVLSEVVIDGWRFELEIEPAARARLRERALRGAGGAGGAARSGPTEVRAMIPGVIIAVTVHAGDAVTAGQPLVVVEAMKMENEIRAPRSGAITRLAVVPGQTVDLGDLLAVVDETGPAVA